MAPTIYCMSFCCYQKPTYVLLLQGALKPPAGICAVPVAGVENVDLSNIVEGHLDYTTKMDEVLDALQLS